MSVAVASVAAEPFSKLPALQAEVPKRCSSLQPQLQGQSVDRLMLLADYCNWSVVDVCNVLILGDKVLIDGSGFKRWIRDMLLKLVMAATACEVVRGVCFERFCF